jgi:UPF0042 nucleotide-binding protein
VPKAKAKHTIRTIIVSGLSGSGKTTAIHALEDMDFYCVDNLPVVLMDQVLSLCERASVDKIAVVIDVREGAFLQEYEQSLTRIRQNGYVIETLFLTCHDEVLIRRFKETRRRHPLQEEGSVKNGIQREREALGGIRESATHIMDTSDHTVHTLRQLVQESFQEAPMGPFKVRLVSFGFKHGIPLEADFVFDVRFLPNPYFDDSLRPLTGLDPQVKDYLEAQADTEPLLDHLDNLLSFSIPRAEQEGKPQLTIAVGCTGGHHRSVMVVEALSQRLKNAPGIRVQHRDVQRNGGNMRG